MTKESVLLVMFAMVVFPCPARAQVAMARVTGVVVDERDRPLAGVSVALPCPPAKVRYTTTDESGNFLLENLPPANCRLLARKDGYLEASHPGEPGLFVPGGYTFVIREGESRDSITLRLSLGGQITGRITTPEGEVPPKGYLHLIRREIINGSERQTVTLGPVRPDGIFLSSPLPAGDYFVASGPAPDNGSAVAPAEFAVTYFPGVVDITEASLVKVRVGETTPDVSFRRARVKTRTVSGTALDSAGQPLTSGVAVISFDSRPAFIRGTVPLDRMGQFVIRGLQPGRYRLTVRRDDASGRAIEYTTTELEIGLHDITDLALRTKRLR